MDGKNEPALDYEGDVSAEHLRDHIELLMHKVDPNDLIYNGFDEEFNYIENKTAKEQFFVDYTSAMLPANKIKNRYSNVLPPETTRVTLSLVEGEEGSDYINANFIRGLIPNSDTAYIATQGPLQSTFPDFWRMIWEKGIAVVVMLTKEVENGRLKCDRYWPEMDCPLTVSNYKITMSDMEETSKDELIERKLTLTNMKTGESRPVTHLQYIAWPDHGLPTSTTAFLALMDEAFKFNNTEGPIVVHCSAGIGRSGTFCIVHATIEKLKLDLKQFPDKEPKFNIIQSVLAARSQRPGMVQTKEQYMFVYLAILEKAKELLQEHREKRSRAQVSK